MKRSCFVLMMPVLCLIAHKATAMQENYQVGQSYSQSGITLGNPTQIDDGFLQRNKDTSHLQNMNDTTLSEQGSDAYQHQSIEEESSMRSKSAKQASDTMAASGQKAQSSHQALQTDHGNLLTHSEVATIDATQEHKIEPKDQLYKSSFAIESDPLNKTGGTAIKTSNKITKTTDHICEEGVQFKVDVVNQLTYVPPPLTPPKNLEFSGKGVTNYRNGYHNVGSYFTLPYAGILKSFTITATVTGEVTNANVATMHFKWHGQYLIKIPPIINRVNINTQNVSSTHNYQNLNIPVTVGQKGVFDATGLNWADAPNIRTVYSGIIQVPGYRANEPAKEYWRVITPDSEALTEQHSCHQIKRQCLDTGTKHFDELKITRPCWKEQITYACESQPIDGCQYYQDQGCTLQKSICINKTVNPCAKWQRHYQCKTYEEQHTPGIGETDLFCLGGDCHQPKLAQNKDMNQAVAQLSVFKEIQKNMANTNPPTVFRGEVNDCSIKLIGFNDCCASMSGWGSSMGLANCSEGEKALAQKKAKKLCHYIGTYCAEKIKYTGICVRKKSTYCCFANKLARVFHEQGRPQLGRGWGSAEHPECGAFIAHELQNIKFEKMDLSEIFQDVFKGVGAKALKAVPRQMQNQMPTAQTNIEKMREEALKKGDGSVTKQVF